MDLWNCEEPVRELDADLVVPDWINQDISPSTVAAIVQGGCASGAYMPAVTYYDAKNTMGEHGDEIFDYFDEHMGERPRPKEEESWDGLACFYVSCAVEIWAAYASDKLEAMDEPEQCAS